MTIFFKQEITKIITKKKKKEEMKRRRERRTGEKRSRQTGRQPELNVGKPNIKLSDPEPLV